MVALALPLLIGLGLWQMERKDWKDGLLAAIAARSTGEPVAFPELIDGLAGKPASAAEYTRVKVSGRFLHDKELFYYAPHPTMGPGYHVYTPLVFAPGRTVFVNRGYLPERLKDRSQRAAAQVEGETEVVGLMRATAERLRFAVDNDAKGNLWFWRDLPAMAAAAGVTGGPVAAVSIDAEGEAPGGFPKGGVTELRLPNRHLEYALTWFGLAAALAVIYGLFAIERLRNPAT
jgi:surfeit locus 1 family protein